MKFIPLSDALQRIQRTPEQVHINCRVYYTADAHGYRFETSLEFGWGPNFKRYDVARRQDVSPGMLADEIGESVSITVYVLPERSGGTGQGTFPPRSAGEAWCRDAQWVVRVP